MSRQIVTIVMMIVGLVAIIVLKGRCGKAVEGMFKAIDQPGQTAVSDGAPPRD